MPLKSLAHSLVALPVLGFAVLPIAANAACTISSVVPVAFGTINPLDAVNVDSAGSIAVSCDALTPYSIVLGSGAGAFAARTMVSGGNLLEYNLYVDELRTLIWGDGTGGSQTVAGSADITGTLHTVYGRVPAQVEAVPGTYSDSVAITVTF